MGKMPLIDVIGFDADDTLWHNEDIYSQAKTRFVSLFSNPEDPLLTTRQVLHKLDDTEIGNVSVYGYGIKSFLLSMLETAVDLSDEKVPIEKLEEVFRIGRGMLETAVPLFPDAEWVLEDLSIRYPLLLITKGDTFEQSRKIRRTGLERYFKAVEIVGDKTADVYQEILERHRIDPAHFIMIGNSQRSDILPVIALGGMAVYIPYENTWTHEQGDAPSEAGGRFYVIEHLRELPELIRNIARD